MLRQWWKRHTDDADEGAATAEFAVVLPCVAAVATVTSTVTEPVAPRLAWSICTCDRFEKLLPALVMKSRLPSSRRRPWKVVV